MDWKSLENLEPYSSKILSPKAFMLSFFIQSNDLE